MFFSNKNPLVTLLLLHYLFMSNLIELSSQQNKNFHFEGEGLNIECWLLHFAILLKEVISSQTLTLYHQILKTSHGLVLLVWGLISLHTAVLTSFNAAPLKMNLYFDQCLVYCFRQTKCDTLNFWEKVQRRVFWSDAQWYTTKTVLCFGWE